MENRTRNGNDDPRPGDMIDGRFRVIQRLTPARSGWRWLVEQVPLGRQVELVLIEAAPGSPDVAARFEREAQALCRLSHPNVLRVFDRGTWNGRPYLVTEHIEGPSLAEILAEGPMDPGRLIALVRQIASALGDAHENGLVHRDLRPENVRVLRNAVDDEVARVVDFGLVEDLGPTSADITEPGSMVGTPAYMAPEQIRGGYIDRRADIYGLGVMLYRGLVGWVPFEGAAGKIFQAQLEQPPPPFPPDIVLPPVLEWTTRVCLAKDPRDRFGSMADLAQALRACSVALVDPPLWDVVLKLQDGQTVVPPELADPGASWSTAYRTPAPIPRAAMPPAAPPPVEPPRMAAPAAPAPTPAPAAMRPAAPLPTPVEPPPASHTARNGMMGLAVLGVALVAVLGIGAVGLAIAGVGIFGRTAPQAHDPIAVATPPAPQPLIDREPAPAPPAPEDAAPPPEDPPAAAGTAAPLPADVAPEPTTPAPTTPATATTAPPPTKAAPGTAPVAPPPSDKTPTTPAVPMPAHPPGTPDAAVTAPAKVDLSTTAKVASPASDEGTASPAPTAATSTTATIAAAAPSPGTAAPGVAGPRTFHVSEVKVKRQLPFEYPEPARKLGLGDAECKVRVVLDLQGAAVRVDDVSCPKAFSQAAKDTLTKWRWVAPEVGGQPVEAQFLMTVRYTVR